MPCKHLNNSASSLNMSTCDLLSVTPAELVVNPRPFRLEGLKPWNCLTSNGHKADKSGQRPSFYLIMTNIKGHEVVNVDALVLKVSLKVGLGLGRTRPPPFKKKYVCHVGLGPSRKKCWMPSYYWKKHIFGPTKMGNDKFFIINIWQGWSVIWK